MNKKKEWKYLAINELENKVFKEQKQERKRHGNKRQEGETARKAEYKQHGSRNRERARNRGEERESGRGTGASGRTEETRTEKFFGRAARTEQGGGWENKQGKKERTENKNWNWKPKRKTEMKGDLDLSFWLSSTTCRKIWICQKFCYIRTMYWKRSILHNWK